MFPGGNGGRCVRLTTYHHPVPLSRNLGTLTSWNPLDHSRPVMGLIYLYLLHDIQVAGLSPRKPKFDPRLVHVRFAVDEVALEQVLLRALQFSPRQYHSTIATWLYSSACSPYLKDKWAKPRNFPKNVTLYRK